MSASRNNINSQVGKKFLSQIMMFELTVRKCPKSGIYLSLLFTFLTVYHKIRPQQNLASKMRTLVHFFPLRIHSFTENTFFACLLAFLLASPVNVKKTT